MFKSAVGAAIFRGDFKPCQHYIQYQVDPENDDIVYTPIRMMCESQNQTYWIGTFYVINGLLLTFGAFLAWETRKVSIPVLNDSKLIGTPILLLNNEYTMYNAQVSCNWVGKSRQQVIACLLE